MNEQYTAYYKGPVHNTIEDVYYPELGCWVIIYWFKLLKYLYEYLWWSSVSYVFILFDLRCYKDKHPRKRNKPIQCYENDTTLKNQGKNKTLFNI